MGAAAATPESLGHYLTWLVAEKNRSYPLDDAELYAAGMLATLQALTLTHPDHPAACADRCRAAVMVMARQLDG